MLRNPSKNNSFIDFLYAIWTFQGLFELNEVFGVLTFFLFLNKIKVFG